MKMAQEASQAAQKTQMLLYQPHHAHGGGDWAWKMFKFQIDSLLSKRTVAKQKTKVLFVSNLQSLPVAPAIRCLA